MIFTWLNINRILWFATIIVVFLGIALPFQLLAPYDSSDALRETQVSAVAEIRHKENRVVPEKLSLEDIQRASRVKLQRMQSPKPAPPLIPPPPTTPVVQSPPLPVPTILFPGSLVGTIEDNNPKYCFAILKWPDSRIQLIAQGESLTDQTESPTVDAITSRSVTLKRKNQQQVLEVPYQE